MSPERKKEFIAALKECKATPDSLTDEGIEVLNELLRNGHAKLHREHCFVATYIIILEVPQ